MIKKMELRFTIVAISVISLVLLILMILVNIISIQGNISRADGALERLAMDDGLDKKKPEDQLDLKGPEGIIGPADGKEMNRSFRVVLDTDNELIVSNAEDRNIIDKESSYEMALLVIDKTKESGFIEDFRYLKIENSEETLIQFLDYSFERQTESRFILVSIGAYFASILLVTFLVVIFLKPVMKSIKESYAKQKQFITDASHELKTPLTVISTDMQIIEMESGSSEWIESVNYQVTRLNALTNELVTLSRMDEEEVQVIISDVNVSDMVNDVVMGFEPAIEAKGKSLELSIVDDLKVKGNYDSLERVMSILLSNALKYSDDQGYIDIKVFTKGKKTYISVLNSVDDIIKGNHDEFFERFYRSDVSRNSKTGGFGIGLAIAKAIIEEHKGKIEAKSTNTKSLEVLVTLRS